MGSHITLVPVGALEPSTVESLGLIVTGQKAKPNRGFGVYCDVRDAAGSGVADIVEVLGSSPNDHSQGNESVKVVGQGSAGHRQFEGSWHPDDGWVTHSTISQSAQGTVE